MTKMTDKKRTTKELAALACKAQTRSYSPYSGFATGAALEAADGQVFLGCSLEPFSGFPNIFR